MPEFNEATWRTMSPAMREQAIRRAADVIFSELGLPGANRPNVTGALDPTPADPPALLEPIQRCVERRQREAQRAARTIFDASGDLVAMQRLLVDQCEDEQVGAAFLGGIDRGPVDETALHI